MSANRVEVRVCSWAVRSAWAEASAASWARRRAFFSPSRARSHSPTATGRDMATTARNSTCSTDTWVTAWGSGEDELKAPMMEFPVEPWLASRKSAVRVPTASSAPVAHGTGSRRDRDRRTTVVKAMSPTVVSR